MQLLDDKDPIRNRLKEVKRRLMVLLDNKEQVENQLSFLQKENRELRNLCEVQKNTIKDLEEKNKISKLADEIVSSENSTSDPMNFELKLKLNEYIRDIDNCIKLLKK